MMFNTDNYLYIKHVLHKYKLLKYFMELFHLLNILFHNVG